jgi:hypothetical protein
MKVVYTEDALNDLDAIADWLIVHYPAVAPAIERRVRRAVANIAQWPESARRSARQPRHSRDVAWPISIQDFLSCRGRYSGNTAHPPRRAAALERPNLTEIALRLAEHNLPYDYLANQRPL